MLTAIATGALLAAAPQNTAPQNTVQSSDSVLGGAAYTKLPETWDLSYDVAMQPYIDDYKKCLGYGNLVLNGTVNVERQHRADVPRCADVRASSIDQSNAVLVRRGRSDSMPPAKVSEAFDTLGYIHIQRGRNLDELFQLQVRATEERQRLYAAQIAARDAELAREAETTSADDDAKNAIPNEEPANVGN